jgi:hypothetical protein
VNQPALNLAPARPEPTSTAPVLELGATKSSHRWTEMPGNWDRLNTRALFPSDNLWGIPTLPATEFQPARLVAYSSRHETMTAAAARTATPGAAPISAVHFFLDDYRFEVTWSKPQRGLSRCQAVGAALTPDFSLWSNMPLVMQMWQVYRSRWCGAWLLHHGVTVIPTVSWSTPESYAVAFAGIEPGSVVAVSTVGTRRDPEARELFAAGLAEMGRRLRPAAVLVYGTPPTEQEAAELPDDTLVRCYPSRWENRGTRRGGGR